MLKAYRVHPGESAYDDGCVLVFARHRNEARTYAFGGGPWIGVDYIDYRAIREPEFDQYAKGEFPYMVETNDELPKDVKFFDMHFPI